MFTATFNETIWFAIAEPSRHSLVDILLAGGEASASKLAKEVPFTRQAVSKHLMVLKKAGLIRSRRIGKEVRFAVDPAGISAAAQEMSRAAELWNVRLHRIKLIAEDLEQRENAT
jgi:DNA-binding transcriptional ArsR family regulator